MFPNGGRRLIKMKCDKCVDGVIMKQISVAEYIPIECDCIISKWFESLRH